MLTNTELKAKSLAAALHSEPKGFGAAEAKIAVNKATALFQAGKCDAATFGSVVADLGNHSAIRQWAIAHGFLSTSDDALTIAVQAEIKAIDDEMEKL